MAKFIQLQQGEETFNKCLKAINRMASSESWIDMFNDEANKKKYIPQIEVLLHYWPEVKNTNIEWEYQNVYAQAASYEYENSRGVKIIIKEGRNRRSEVIEFIGLPEEYRSYFEGLDNVSLSENIDRYIKNRIDVDGLELRVAEYTR